MANTKEQTNKQDSKINNGNQYKLITVPLDKEEYKEFKIVQVRAEKFVNDLSREIFLIGLREYQLKQSA